MQSQNPPLFVMSAPSGAGKTTIFKIAQDVLPNLILSVSFTTRKPRKNELDGKDYCFIEEEQFRQMIADNEFLEWAKVHGNYYGTSHRRIKESWKSGQIVVLDVDVQGAMQLKEKTDIEAIYIFIKPPSREDLKARLINRGTEDKVTLETRIKNADWELSFEERYDYVIINDEIDDAVSEFVKIIHEKSVSPNSRV